MSCYIPPVITVASSRALATDEIPAGPVSPKLNFPSRLATKILYVFLVSPCILHIPFISSFSNFFFYHPLMKSTIVKLLIIHFSQSFSSLLSLVFKYCYKIFKYIYIYICTAKFILFKTMICLL
jgi:hypothetical protein